MTAGPYDAILLVSFGGPEGPDDVIPFLENVTRGRGVPPERLREVAQHYDQFGGVSPINQQNRDLLAVLEPELAAHGIDLPIYWGNRNWHPFVADEVQRMADDGVRRALAFVTSAYSSYSGCRQYREDIARARETVGDGAPEIDKVRVFYNHPDFVETQARLVAETLDGLDLGERASDASQRSTELRLAFTAHSIPVSMAASSDYQDQLLDACGLVTESVMRQRPALGNIDWSLVFQSRSGPPQVPWLEPDICDHLRAVAADGVKRVVMVPVGFVSDHLEVLFDLDTEACEVAAEVGVEVARAPTVGVDPRFVSMIRQLVQERLDPGSDQLAVGARGPNHDVCPVDCCPAPVRPATRQ